MTQEPTRTKAEIAAAKRFARMGGRARAAKHPMTREQMAELGRKSGAARRARMAKCAEFAARLIKTMNEENAHYPI